eukprot:gene2966-4047_t
MTARTIYTLSDRASDAEAERLAELENKADAIGGVNLTEEPTDVADILIDLAQRETRTFSNHFARLLAGEMKQTARMHKHPLKSAGFRVLKAPDVPSVLIELGYVSNKADLQLMVSESWRSKTVGAVAQAILRGISEACRAACNLSPDGALILDGTVHPGLGFDSRVTAGGDAFRYPRQEFPEGSRRFSRHTGMERLQKFGAAALSAVGHGLVAGLVIWAFYGFHYAAFNPALPPADHFVRPWEVLDLHIGFAGKLIRALAAIHALPEAFLYGFAYVLETAQVRSAFLNGEYSTTGWPSFFPWAFALKTTLPVLAATALVATLTARRWLAAPTKLRSDLYRIAPLAALFV